MKKLLFVGLVVCSAFGLQAKTKQIQGVAKGATNGNWVYLYRYFGADLEVIDSTQINKERFKFSRKSGYLEGIYKLGKSSKASKNIILKEDQVTVEFNLDQVESTLKCVDSKENQLYQQYSKFLGSYFGSFQRINNSFYKISSLRQTNINLYNQKATKLLAELDSIHKAADSYHAKMAQDHPDTYTGLICKTLSIKQETTKENYLKKEEFADSRLVMGDALFNKINFYYIRFLGRIDKSNIAATNNEILASTDLGSDGRELVFATLYRIAFNIEQSEAWRLYRQYKKEYPGSIHAKNFFSSVIAPPPEIGDMAPDIVLKDTSGVIRKLSSLKGKVVLLDFWASWCRPCRGENPNVVRAYHKFKDKGFTVMSVSLDKSRSRWIQAIKQDGLVWPDHVSDLQGWSSAGAKIYQVRGIPAAFLIDREGKIVAKNLRGESLDRTLTQLLGE